MSEQTWRYISKARCLAPQNHPKNKCLIAFYLKISTIFLALTQYIVLPSL